MMEKFVIISKNELSPSMEFSNIKAIPLFINDEETEFLILSVKKENEELLKQYKKYNASEIALIRLGSLKDYKISSSTTSCIPPFAMKYLSTGEALFKRVHGMGELILDAGEIGDFEFQVPYPWCKLEGIQIMDQADKCQAELFIEDSDEGIYSGYSRYELNQFGFDVEIPKENFEKKSSYDSDLFFGMYVVLQITNTSNQTQTIRANVELDEVRS
jgi:hypothetical protein